MQHGNPNPLTTALVEQLWEEATELGDMLPDWHRTKKDAVGAYMGFFETLEAFLERYPEHPKTCLTDRDVLNINNHYFTTGSWVVV